MTFVRIGTSLFISYTLNSNIFINISDTLGTRSANLENSSRMLELQEIVRIVPLENMQNMLFHHREIRTILRRKNSLGLQETTPTALRVMMGRFRMNNIRHAQLVL